MEIVLVVLRNGAELLNSVDPLLLSEVRVIHFLDLAVGEILHCVANLCGSISSGGCRDVPCNCKVGRAFHEREVSRGGGCSTRSECCYIVSQLEILRTIGFQEAVVSGLCK